MALVFPFSALRPVSKAANAVAAVPYDVVSTDEAKKLVESNTLNFLHVSRAEIDLPPGTDPYSKAVYQTAADNFEQLKRTAPLIKEEHDSLYFYRLKEGSHEQTGLAGCYSLDDYDKNLIRKHERTRRDKEDDRTRHILALRAQTGIALLVYRESKEINAVKMRTCQSKPLLDVVAADGVQHTIWRLDAEDESKAIAAFHDVPMLYIGDGHHRIASAARVRDELVSSVSEGADIQAHFFLGVAFPDTEVRILAYNRAVSDLAGHTTRSFLEEVSAKFSVRADADPLPTSGQVSMYLAGTWYAVDLEANQGSVSYVEPSARLDVSLLQDQLLAPLLRVEDVRTDPRIVFIGGSRGIVTLEALVNSGEAAVAFSLAPVEVQQLLAVSDAGDIMPPKSTWFEPKLRDGLLIHVI